MTLEERIEKIIVQSIPNPFIPPETRIVLTALLDAIKEGDISLEDLTSQLDGLSIKELTSRDWEWEEQADAS